MEVITPDVLQRGAAFQGGAKFKNIGLARLYETWNAYLRLTGPATREIDLGWIGSNWSGVENSRPWESIPTPADLPLGTYSAQLVVRDPSGARTRPMPLANQVTTAGGIDLGTILVQEAPAPQQTTQLITEYTLDGSNFLAAGQTFGVRAGTTEYSLDGGVTWQPTPRTFNVRVRDIIE